MTARVKNLSRTSSGSTWTMNGQIDCDASYPTGGYPLYPVNFGLSQINTLEITGNENGFFFEYDYTNFKLKIYQTAGFTPAGTISNNSAGTPSGNVTVNPANYTPAGTVSQPTFTADATAFSYITQAYDGLLGATVHTAQNPNADGAEKVNASAVAPYTTVAAGAWTVGAITNPDVPRGVMISIQNDSGGPLDLFEGATNFTVTGTSWNGTVISSLISFVSNAGNKTVANGQFRSSYGNGLPFRTVTGVTVENPPADGLKISVGLGTRIQLLTPITGLTVNDVIRATVNNTAITPVGNVQSYGAGLFSFIYPTFANNDTVKATYKSPTGATGVVSQPTFAGTPQAFTASFVGNAMANHGHTFAGTPVGAGGATEVPNGTNLSSLINLEFQVVGL